MGLLLVEPMKFFTLVVLRGRMVVFEVWQMLELNYLFLVSLLLDTYPIR